MSSVFYLIYESIINLDFGLSFSTVVEKSNERKNAAQLNFAPNRNMYDEKSAIVASLPLETFEIKRSQIDHCT